MRRSVDELASSTTLLQSVTTARKSLGTTAAAVAKGFGCTARSPVVDLPRDILDDAGERRSAATTTQQTFLTVRSRQLADSLRDVAEKL